MASHDQLLFLQLLSTLPPVALLDVSIKTDWLMVETGRIKLRKL